MTVQPLIPLWLLTLITAAGFSFIAMQVRAARGTRRAGRWRRRSALIAATALMLLNPALERGTARSQSLSLDVVFVVDTTSSIAAEDYDGSRPRIVGVRRDIKQIAARLAGARMSLISFDRAATMRVPFTSDVSAITTAAEVLEQEITNYSHGSSIDTPRELLRDTLAARAKRYPNRGRVVFYLGDGEQTADASPRSLAATGELVGGGGVLGYGSRAGGRMREHDGYSDAETAGRYISDNSTKQYPAPDALSRIDEGNLRAIATQLGVPYTHRDADTSVAGIADRARRAGATSRTGKSRVPTPSGLYWVAALLVCGLVVIELPGIMRLVRSAPRPGWERT